MTAEYEQMIELPPSIGWVVHLVEPTRQGGPQLMAWCKVSVDAPGYSEVTFFLLDGVTPADHTGDLRLGEVITKVWC